MKKAALRSCFSRHRRSHRHQTSRRRRRSIALETQWCVCRSEKLRKVIWSTRWTAAIFQFPRASILGLHLYRNL